MMKWLRVLTLLNDWRRNCAETNPHQPYKQTWILTHGETGRLLYEPSHVAPLSTWWPDLIFCFRDINLAYQSTASNLAHSYGFYACPGHSKGRQCGGVQYSFCKSWACVTSNDGDWRWAVSRPDFLKLAFVNQGAPRGLAVPLPQGPCSPQDSDRIQAWFTDEGRQEGIQGWIQGKQWGIVFYKYEGHAGSTIVFRLKFETPQTSSAPVGPNKVLTIKPQSHREVTRPTQPPRAETPAGLPSQPQRSQATEDPLWKLMHTIYETLNPTSPNLTASCWLCYDVKPPFYEAIGLNITHDVSSDTSPSQCSWGDRKIGLTLQHVSSSGTCLIKVSQNKQGLCASINSTPSWKSNSKWLIPKSDGWWICTRTGLTPCLSTLVFNASKEFCVLVTVMPRILYHPEESMYSHWSKGTSERSKREAITALTIATLFSLGMAGARTGIASLATQHTGMTPLRAAIDEDLERIETSISHLEKSLTSLSEVVLQNRRGLDLLFLQKGGLCATLGEECCFYADHTGVRKKEREAQESWFEAWFNKSPWLTTLVSTLVGPFVLFVLILTFGPCILNKLIKFVKDHVNTVQLMVLTQQYERLPTPEDPYELFLSKAV
uniref:Envelope glycoprotein n=1 Tax=Moschus moschiferus TaxID=68415 RepID=A0A8C6DFM5_MOSMO